MKIFRPLQLSFSHRVLEQNRKFHFIASATLGINLRTGESLLEFEQFRDAFECMGEKPIPDTCMPKPCGEYLVSGNYFSPGQKAVTGGEVKIKVGKKEKSLYVFGPRKWQHGAPCTPEPIASMPIDYTNAFGGQKYKKNPDGLGYKDGLLPCIEDAKKLITSPDDRPEPAGFSPLDPSWPQRMRFQPTYDGSYREKYFPGYPPDFDWHYFLCAPRDQRIDGFFKGDEPYELYNMHPELPVIKGALPGLYARCFIRHTLNGTEPEFSELPLNLDTIWFFPEKLLALLIWRGGIEVADDEALQISHVLLAYEDRGHQPRSQEHYREALDKRMTGDNPLLNNFNTEDLIPVGAKCAMELLQEMALSDSEKSEFSKNMEAKAESIKKAADEKIEEAIQQAEKQMEDTGTPDEEKVKLRKMIQERLEPKPDPDVEALNQKLESILPGITAGDPKKIELKNFSFDKIDRITDAVGELTDKKEKKARAQVKEQLEKVLEGMTDAPEETRAKLKETVKMIKAGETPKAPLPRLDIEGIISQLSLSSPQLMGAMQHVAGMKHAEGESEQTESMEKQINETMDINVREIEDKLHQAKEGFKDAYTMGAHFMEHGLSPHKEPVETVARHLLKSISDGQDVSGGDWACIDLSGRNLDGIDLSGAYLEQVNFKGASLKGANLNKAIMARANLEDADLSGANLEGANVGGVHALRANFTGANMKSAKLSKGDFTDADFTRSELEEAESLEIIVTGATFAEAHMPGMKFIESEIQGVKFPKADLNTSVFYDCAITDIDFTEAIMTSCVFADARLKNVRFNNADLTQACFAATDPGKTSMEKVRFVEACLNKANFQGMAMRKTDFSGASMENANFAGADMTGARLTGAQAKNAQFRKAQLVGARLDRINLMEGSCAKANLADASFAGANLYCVDFLRSNINNTDFSTSNLDGTLIEEWRPK
ncbi:MAG: DUF2169 domain-containing protein [Chitinispirillaceae bacterium]|nr:DUF2169 domain-containing protein [Chitinispirillaceae bacterium]